VATTKQTGLQSFQRGSNGRVAKSAVHPCKSLRERRFYENHVRKKDAS